MLMTLLSGQPGLVGEIVPWISAQAATLLEACQQQLSQQAECARDDMLPPALVTPPGGEKEKIPHCTAESAAAPIRAGLYADGRGKQTASRTA